MQHVHQQTLPSAQLVLSVLLWILPPKFVLVLLDIINQQVNVWHAQINVQHVKLMVYVVLVLMQTEN